ncbi:hypothetical protein D9611_011627 [Ephemerocybe angulata]|uniref:C2H2-type domain-containing protein n=1 Tax=Ephemerocybe angulata TaxID=980116 RepID=A0A8H5ET54_9AGAR|nr:hypothetical protein D9611_011627 [Tulosesus angulatus]
MPADRTSKKTSAARSSTSPVPADRICTICGRVLGRKADVPRHMKRHDPSAERVQCTYLIAEGVHCPFSTLQPYNLDTHVRTMHTKEPHFCKYADCDYGHTDPAIMSKHYRKVHHEKTKRQAARAPKPRKGKKVEEPSEPVASTSAAAAAIPSPSPSSYSDYGSEYSSDSSSYSTSTSQSPVSEHFFVPALLLQKFEDQFEVGYLGNSQNLSLPGYAGTVTNPDIVDEAAATALHLGYEAINPEPFTPLFCDGPYFPPTYWIDLDANIRSSMQGADFYPDTQELNEGPFNSTWEESYFTEHIF